MTSADLEFVIAVPWAASEQKLVHVKPRPSILDDFLEFATSKDNDELYKFVAMCRKAGVPGREAQRAYRARKRGKQSLRAARR